MVGDPLIISVQPGLFTHDFSPSLMVTQDRKNPVWILFKSSIGINKIIVNPNQACNAAKFRSQSMNPSPLGSNEYEDHPL